MNSTNIFKPISFNNEMVQAILAGRKTQTRRIIKEQLTIDVLEYAVGTNKPLEHFTANASKYKENDVLFTKEKTIQNLVSNKYLYGDEGELTAAMSPFLYKKRPHNQMPKEAARIFLKITKVRCEKLKDISEADAIAEGIEPNPRYDNKGYRDYFYTNESFPESPHHCLYADNSFKSLWLSINGWDSWEKNPWVWVYDFERIEKPENFLS